FAIGDRRFTVVLGTLAKQAKLYVDANRDGDLGNDPPATWRPKNGSASASGYAMVRLPFRGKSVPCGVVVVQSGPKSLMALPDFGYAGSLQLGAKAIPFFMSASPPGAVLGFDRKGNGVISGPAEQFAGDRPFTINGDSYVLKAIDLATATASFVPGEKV